MDRILVTGAGGFIGHHLVSRLKQEGHWVRGVDVKLPEFAASDADQFEILDLRRWDACLEATRGINQVYSLAADMGGMGFISSNHSRILHNNALINLHTMHAAVLNGAGRYFYSSSACIYPEYLQLEEDVVPLREDDAFPAAPQDAYGWEKLFAELLCGYYAGDYGIETRVLRFHNVYGPLGAYEGGREKAPAALCRKVALAEDGDEIELWGDGKQTRLFCYIDDCIEGIMRTMRSTCAEALNMGTDHLVTIDDLAHIIIELAGKKDIRIRHVEGPQGVRGRNSDNSKMLATLGWEPQTSLQDGLTMTYDWIQAQIKGR